MATVYRAPEEVGPPPDFSASFVDGRFDRDRHYEVQEAWLDKLRAWVKGESRHRLAGKIVRIPWADGAAQYMVLDGRRLIHLPLDDAWNVPDYMTRGLRVADLERMAS